MLRGVKAWLRGDGGCGMWGDDWRRKIEGVCYVGTGGEEESLSFVCPLY